ncbi:MAG: phosphoesterase [Betaproteobacteria bacterium HGW-Betaproteobacteria-22]|nr:MAG: phosphoesterase [Betaproteobacteria bacterium HGW-Betaproteobacteria-22]
MTLHKLKSYIPAESFWLKHLLAGLLVAAFMRLVYPVLHIDANLTDLFFDAQRQHFPLKHNLFLTQWMHTGLKWLMVTVAVLSLVLSVSSYFFARIKAYRAPLLWVFVGMVVSTTVVAILKHYNQHACPWDLTVYGGDLPLIALFEAPPAGVELGRCFPAGHPSGGFALMAFYFAFITYRPAFARWMLLLSLVMGLVMGGVQIARGAHFLSHVLWSGWTVWMTLLILYWIWPLRPITDLQK